METAPNNPDSRLDVQPGMKRIWWVAAILTGMGVAVLPFDVLLANPETMEYLPGDLKRFVSLSELFAHGFGVGIIAIGIWLLATDKRRFIPRIALCAFWPAAGVSLLKVLVGRFRPVKYLDETSTANYPANIFDTWIGWLPDDQLNLVYASQSFPSAHTATTWGLAIGMSWVFPKGRWLFFFVAVLASMQRVSSFAHWTSDVFFGAAIAFVMAGALTQNWGFGYWLSQFENRNAPQLILITDDEPQVEKRRAA